MKSAYGTFVYGTVDFISNTHASITVQSTVLFQNSQYAQYN